MNKSIVIKILLTCLALTFSQLTIASNNNISKKDSSGVLEVVMFSSNNAYTDEQVVKRAYALTSILRSYTGFLSRKFSENVKGRNEWVDVVHWSSLHDALMAAKKIVKTPQMKKFMAVMEKHKMYHFQIKFKVSK